LKPVFIAKSLEQVLADDFEHLSILFADPPPSDNDTLAENGDASKYSQPGKEESEAVHDSPQGANGTLSEGEKGDDNPSASAPGDFVGKSGPSVSGSSFNWQDLLKLSVIGCLNLIALFGLTLISILEVLSRSPGRNNPGEGPSADGNEDSDAKGENKDDSNSSNGGDDGVTLADGAPSGSSDESPSVDWRALLNDDGQDIFLGLRVYTRTEEPALVTGRLHCEGTELCVCTRK
jgi:hypothetical protein